MLWLVPFILFFSGYALPMLLFQRATISCPNLVGIQLPEAITRCSAQQLNLKILRQRIVAGAPEGAIIEQLPARDQLVRHGSDVWVTIVQQQIPKTPNLLGKSAQEVTAIAAEHHLVIKQYELPIGGSTNTCFAQYPQPNQEMRGHDMVAYLVAPKSRQFVIPDVVGQQYDQIKIYLQQEKIDHDVVYKTPPPPNIDESKYIIIGQRPYAGTIVDATQPLFLQLHVDVKK